MKTILFVSDIEGTITPDNIYNDVAKEKAYHLLAKLLLKLKKQHEADKVIFSLATSHHDPKIVTKHLNDMKTIFEENNIIIGKCFLERLYYQNGECNSYPVGEDSFKLNKIIRYIDELKSQDNDIIWFGFADDSLGIVSHEYFKDMMETEVPYDIFVPGNKDDSKNNNLHISKQEGILGLNDCILTAVGDNSLLNEFEEIKNISSQKQEAIIHQAVREESKNNSFIKKLMMKFNTK